MLPDAAHLVLEAARGQAVVLPPELARELLAAPDDRATACAIGLDRASRVKIRDDALVEAAGWLTTDDATTWQAAQRLAAGVAYFESRIWPRLQAGAALDLAPSELALERAFRARSHRMLRDVGKLFDLLKLHGWPVQTDERRQ
jgi:hypothetical protein